MQNNHHNMSMFDKIGPSSKMQQSPGQIDFHNKVPTHLKPVGKMPGHNQSFDSIPMHSKLVSHSGQHGSKLGGSRVDNKLVSSAQHSLKGAQMPSHSGSNAAMQGVVSGSGGQSRDSQNPQAYDELKKRLLNEYKKLVNNKKTSGDGRTSTHEQHPDRDHGRNLAIHQKSGESRQTGKGTTKKHSSRVAGPTSVANNAGSGTSESLGNVNGLS